MSQSIVPTSRLRLMRYAALAAVVFVPLAFAGLFVGAVSQVGKGIDNIPAAIVNNDTIVYTTAADGTKSPVLAGRQLVTELTGKNSAGFNWTITNSKDAATALADGKVFAILTVPSNFSSSIVSLSSSTPQRADLSIRTDDAHNYLTGSVAQAVGDSLVNAFGKTITSQYIAGIYSSFGTVGSSFADAATGANKLSTGAQDLSGGLSTLTGGAASAHSGATGLSGGLTSYVGGVKQLATGLRGFQTQIEGLNASTVGVSKYAGGVSQLSAALTSAVNALAADPSNPSLLATVQSITAEIAGTAASGSQVVGGVNSAFSGLAAGAGQSAAGAEKLVSSGGTLKSGASSLATGLAGIQSGAAQATSGASSLATGASSLATGLKTGADSVPTLTTSQAKANASVAASPVGLTVTRDNKVSDIGQIIATLFVPLGLWIGSLAVFLVMRPATRQTLASTAASGRLVLSAITRASLLTAAQALLLVGLLHISLGVSWSLLPATILFSLVMALAFTAFHYLLTIGLGKAGLIVSLFLLAIQITSTGGLYPIQLLATPFQLVSPFLPLTYGVSGMQAIIANSGAGNAIGAALALAAFGVGSVLVAMFAIRRVRRAGALGLLPTAG